MPSSPACSAPGRSRLRDPGRDPGTFRTGHVAAMGVTLPGVSPRSGEVEAPEVAFRFRIGIAIMLVE
jgi:hypothetical protein